MLTANGEDGLGPAAGARPRLGASLASMVKSGMNPTCTLEEHPIQVMNDVMERRICTTKVSLQGCHFSRWEKKEQEVASASGEKLQTVQSRPLITCDGSEQRAEGVETFQFGRAAGTVISLRA